ncbi:MAG: hypothetical protein K0R72_1032 [Clostridia bacterium]|jgi:hypothetical protein|nr:hypothetical protein [Clostridia bacterium]
MDTVLEYMINKEWEKDYKAKRKIYLINLAEKSKREKDISNKIGSMLIYNQVIEQILKEVIICSVGYIKAEIWPSSIQLDINLDRATFGVLIEYFKQYAVKEYNRDIILEYLQKLNIERNKVVHKLFDIEDIRKLSKQLNEYGDLAYELIILLNEYYDQICWRLYDLNDRVDFESLSE